MGIEHEAVGCVAADRYAQLDACFEPAGSVSRGRVHFRAQGGPHWYYVEMKPAAEAKAAGCFSGILPRPKKSTKGIDYYVEVLDRSFGTGRTPEYSPSVVSNPSECQRKMAGLLNAATVAVGAAPGAPAVPAGFSAVGVVAAGGAASGAAAGATAGAGGGSSGGISGTTLALGGAGAAAVVAAVAVAAGGGGEIDLTGRWSGSSSFTGNGSGSGLVFTLSISENIVMELQHSGSAVSGTSTSTVTSFSCAPDPFGVCAGLVGQSSMESFTGTAADGTITFNFPGGSFSGTYTSTRISGTWTETFTEADFTYDVSGSWSVTRQ